MSDRAVVVRTDKSAETLAADTNGTAWLCARYTQARVYATVSSITGDETLDLTIQTSYDDSTFYTHTAMTQLTASVLTTTSGATNLGKYIRINYNIGGTTPSVVVTVKIVFKT